MYLLFSVCGISNLLAVHAEHIGLRFDITMQVQRLLHKHKHITGYRGNTLLIQLTALRRNSIFRQLVVLVAQYKNGFCGGECGPMSLTATLHSQIICVMIVSSNKLFESS